MSDLIRREDVIEEYIVGFGLTIEDIERIPAVDAEPVKHGRWEVVHDNNGAHHVCPYCGEWRYHSKQLYCGNCGAKMDEVEL